jgi:hypothetical protein
LPNRNFSREQTNLFFDLLRFKAEISNRDSNQIINTRNNYKKRNKNLPLQLKSENRCFMGRGLEERERRNKGERKGEEEAGLGDYRTKRKGRRGRGRNQLAGLYCKTGHIRYETRQ